MTVLVCLWSSAYPYISYTYGWGKPGCKSLKRFNQNEGNKKADYLVGDKLHLLSVNGEF